MSSRIFGIFLFLFIPLVLYLFLVHPLGVSWSFLLGIAVILLHRPVARAYMLRYAGKRCLWCGGMYPPAGRVSLGLGGGREQEFCYCCGACRLGILKFCDLVWRYRVLITAGIFVPLLFYLVTMWVGEFTSVPLLPMEWEKLVFRLGIALTVVGASLAYLAASPASRPRFPFPIHNLFLLGMYWTLWIFRLVGLWWIGKSAVFLAATWKGG